MRTPRPSSTSMTRTPAAIPPGAAPTTGATSISACTTSPSCSGPPTTTTSCLPTRARSTPGSYRGRRKDSSGHQVVPDLLEAVAGPGRHEDEVARREGRRGAFQPKNPAAAHHQVDLVLGVRLLRVAAAG